MTILPFMTVYASGAGAIALWLNYRFPTAMPKSFGWLGAHIVLAMGTSYLMRFAHSERMILIVGFIFVTYSLLVAIWMIRLAQGSMIRR